jgi:RNA polymerase sigma-70 factor (ECF subfamily)
MMTSAEAFFGATMVAKPKAAPMPSMAPDSARFRRMAVQHLDFVWRCLRRLGIPESDADDAAQEVFLIVAPRLDSIPEEKERAFLFATAARIAANARRALHRRNKAYDNYSHALPDVSVSQEQLSDQLRARELLDQILDEMPDELREIFVLFELEELSIAEIAEAVQIPMGTVGSRLRRAREAFNEAVVRHKARANFKAGLAVGAAR